MFALRYLPLWTAFVATIVAGAAIYGFPALAPWLSLPFIAFAGLTFLGLRDLFQTKHAILRNYPILAHLRFLFEKIRPEMRQYFFESEKDGTPFARDKRALVYQRAKQQLDKRPFGTQYDVYADSYEWMQHSLAAKPASGEHFRTLVGEGVAAQPYAASVFNISAMSYGSLSPNAIRALNKGARKGGFAHDTGEGGISPYHLEGGGDIIWEIGTGYFGCRTPNGDFDPEKFATAAAAPQVKMVELKLSQGAKPGQGGILPAAKVTREISKIRGVPMGEDCISPTTHKTFSDPIGLLRYIAEMRRLSGGKPAGFKLCVGHPWEFMAIAKAMVETDITPDFIVVDGSEGGTGAAPLEFMDHVGMPMREGLSFVHNTLVGIGKRDRIRVAASGKIVSGFDMARAMALGADWCNAARGFMFAVGCIQAQTCHTGRCPTGVTSTDPYRQRAIVVSDKSERVVSFHRETIHALGELVAAAGLDHPRDLAPEHFQRRASPDQVVSFAEKYPRLHPGELVMGTARAPYASAWAMARPDTFMPARAFA
ncbi:MAG: FMN-binding glutamate synthase family protein [Hyphomicrobiaceae bacterium]